MTLADLAAWLKENETTLSIQYFGGNFVAHLTWMSVSLTRYDPELETLLKRIVGDMDRWIVNDRAYVAAKNLEERNRSDSKGD
jgi:hypothetical protein